MSEAAQVAFDALIKRRAAREPIAYLTGHRECWSLDFKVTQDVLIPRPETELLIETVLNLFSKDAALSLADLGTGSGTIALSLAHERPAWQVHATDISGPALTVAKQNAAQFSLNNVTFAVGNWCAALPAAVFDVIISNPPYIAESEWADYAQGLAFEPRQALVSGADGLDAIREIVATAIPFLKPGGYLLIEHGFAQGAAVRDIFLRNGYKTVQSLQDLEGRERITLGNF